MPHYPKRHRRHSIRPPGYDFSRPGACFVSICTHDSEHRLAEIAGGVLQPSPFSAIIEDCRHGLPGHYPHVILPDSERALNATRQCGAHSPLDWQLDRYNPNAMAPDRLAVEAWRLLQQDDS